VNFTSSGISNFDIDTANQTLYWAASGTTNNSIGKINFDGQLETVLLHTELEFPGIGVSIPLVAWRIR
jgi:hypothetical protein